MTPVPNRPTLGVLESVGAVVDGCRHVRIDQGRLVRTCAGLSAGSLHLPAWDDPVFARAEPAILAGQILLFNCINFCYWGAPKWSIEYRGQAWDGSFGLLMAIQRGLDEGLPLLDGVYLADVPEVDFEHILRGHGRLHLMEQRLGMWRAAGKALVRNFAGAFAALIAAAQGDALALASLLIEHLPFDDRARLGAREVRFYKRAQLGAAMLYEAFGGQGPGKLARTDRLTVFADYKLPQVLRRLGILVYDDYLAAQVDTLTPLPAGGQAEVEIRLATIWAGELMRQALAARLPAVTALHLDYWLWRAGQVQGPGMPPYHRTLTTAY